MCEDEDVAGTTWGFAASVRAMSSLVPPRDACDGWHERLPFCLTGTASLNLLKKHAACAGDCKARLVRADFVEDLELFR